jgi:hypothetical protein
MALEQGMGSESSHPRQAEILDQLSLFQFLQGKLPEAEMHARRSLAVIQNHFEIGDPAVCMCELRLGAILFSKLLFSRLHFCLVTIIGACCLVTMMCTCYRTCQVDSVRSCTLQTSRLSLVMQGLAITKDVSAHTDSHLRQSTNGLCQCLVTTSMKHSSLLLLQACAALQNHWHQICRTVLHAHVESIDSHRGKLTRLV